MHFWNSQSGFSRVYSNCCSSCSFESEIIKIRQSSHKMYSNNILNFQESTTILNTHTKKVWKLIVCTSYNVEGPHFTHNRHLNQLRRRISYEADSGPSEKTVMVLIYATFNIPTPLLALEICRSNRTEKATDLIIVNPKRRR